MTINRSRKEIEMGVLSWIIVGLIAGWLAEQFIRGPRYGLLGATIIGIVGGLLGGYLASRLLHLNNPITGINLTSILTAFLGSVILLFLIRMVNRVRL
jgi:uncharacterized membrane protein YeaQ/YmgE (transglycosylase-associated protein family)